MKKYMNRAKRNQKGISMIALIVLILVVVIIVAAVAGILTKDNNVDTKRENVNNEVVNSSGEGNNENVNGSEEDNTTPTESEIIVPAGHEHDYAILEKEVEATCTEHGKSYLKCECGAESVVVNEQSLGHSWGMGQMTKLATCQEQGEITYTCERCNETRVEYTEITSHDFSNRTITDDYLNSEATCASPAVYYYKCQNCDEHGESTYAEGESLGHRWDEGETTIEPTTSKEGKKTYTCTVCEETRVESIPAIEE